jgi:hypothetical protein
MNKETEEILMFAIIGLVALKLLTGASSSSTSALSLAKLQTQQNLGFATDATSVVNNAIADWS